MSPKTFWYLGYRDTLLFPRLALTIFGHVLTITDEYPGDYPCYSVYYPDFPGAYPDNPGDFPDYPNHTSDYNNHPGEYPDYPVNKNNLFMHEHLETALCESVNQYESVLMCYPCYGYSALTDGCCGAPSGCGYGAVHAEKSRIIYFQNTLHLFHACAI